MAICMVRQIRWHRQIMAVYRVERGVTSRGTLFLELKGRDNAPALLYIPGVFAYTRRVRSHMRLEPLENG